MNNDGIGFLGAGMSDNRLEGPDLQHNRQTRKEGYRNASKRVVTQQDEAGGPMKQHLDQEMQRHQEAKATRLKHLEDHYKR